MFFCLNFSFQRCALLRAFALVGATVPAEAVQPSQLGLDFAAPRVQANHGGAGGSGLQPARHPARSQAVCSQTGNVPVQAASSIHLHALIASPSSAAVGLRSRWWGGIRGGHRGCGGPAPRAHLLPAEEHAGHRGARPAQTKTAVRHLPEAGRQRPSGPAPLHRVQVRTITCV